MGKGKKIASGLFWQYDVRDAMEETISGGRKEKNPRPSINGYMYGNAVALHKMNLIDRETGRNFLLQTKADSLKSLLQSKLWNVNHNFFEVRKEQGDTFSQCKRGNRFYSLVF